MHDYTIDMGFDEFERLPELKRTLAGAIVRGLFGSRDADVLTDYTCGGTFTGGSLLRSALALSRTIRRATPAPRVGIVMPPCRHAAVANYACIFAGKTPVNLNFTMGRAAAESCLSASGIEAAITTPAMRAKISEANPGFPWAPAEIDISSALGPAESALPEAAQSSPEAALEWLGLEEFGENRGEATLIFTSGSEGAPKAAVLTGRNIIANCLQTHMSRVFEPGDLLLGNLPVFHSFGLLFEVWFMALHGMRTLMVASPIDIKANLRAIREFSPSVMIGSPTFFRAYLRHASKDDMKSLRKVIAGAEKTPEGFHGHWNGTFGENTYSEGYGLTETSPVVGVNLPQRDFGFFSTGSRAGSIGKIFPGMSARILDPSTLEPLPFGHQGLLSMRGANVFAGYLANPEATAATLRDGWIVTGDLARLDRDGFLYVDGRLSRFSKIGGEMVPHATVEAALSKALGLNGLEAPALAVSARMDEDKGEALVLVSAVEIEMARVKEALRSEGISNLWMPKHIVRVAKIPLLASGKLDLKELANMAKG